MTTKRSEETVADHRPEQEPKVPSHSGPGQTGTRADPPQNIKNEQDKEKRDQHNG